MISNDILSCGRAIGLGFDVAWVYDHVAWRGITPWHDAYTTRFWSVHDAMTGPGCVQRPRVPFAIAGTGPRAMRLAAKYADTWVTAGAPRPDSGVSCYEAVRTQLAQLAEVTAAEGRTLRTLLRTGAAEDPWMDSIEAYRDLAGRYGELGITDLALHWPHERSPFASDRKVLEQIAAEHAA